MKKIVFMILFLVFFSLDYVNCQAQNNNGSKLSVGIIGGANLADMYFPNNVGAGAQEISSLLGIGLGAVLEFELSETFHIVAEPMYMQKGCKIEEGADLLNQPAGQINSAFIETPIFIKYIFSGSAQPYLAAGTYFAYYLNSEIEFDLTGLHFQGDLKDVTETFDFGLTFGGGVQFPINFGSFFVEGRYSFGLINQRKTGAFTVSSTAVQFDMETEKEDDKTTNRGFQIFAGLLLPI